MVLDPIRPNELPTVAQAGPTARDAAVRPQQKPSAPVVTPVAAPLADTNDEINVKWDRSDGVIVTFTDKESGNMIRQIPSEQVLSVARFIRQMLEKEGAANSAGTTAGSEKTQ